MEVLFTILKFAVVLVLGASLLEALVMSMRRGWRNYDWRATGISLIDFLVREYPLRWLLPLAFWTNAMDWFWQHRLWDLPMHDWRGWLACFIGQEFCYYWYHRAAHRMRWFWCTHAVHHSPNELNLSAAYRFGWTGRLTGTLLFFMLAPLLGMPPKIIQMMLALNLLYQFWIHATWIPRLGPLEWFLNTPSAHRVHHASNLEYLDCNYGGVLIIFDRLFGTYIAERTDLPCRFGLVEPIRGYNLWRIEFAQWQALCMICVVLVHSVNSSLICLSHQAGSLTVMAALRKICGVWLGCANLVESGCACPGSHAGMALLLRRGRVCHHK